MAAAVAAAASTESGNPPACGLTEALSRAKVIPPTADGHHSALSSEWKRLLPTCRWLRAVPRPPGRCCAVADGVSITAGEGRGGGSGGGAGRVERGVGSVLDDKRRLDVKASSYVHALTSQCMGHQGSWCLACQRFSFLKYQKCPQQHGAPAPAHKHALRSACMSISALY